MSKAKKTYVLLAVSALALILLALAFVRIGRIKASLPCMYAAERSEGRAEQVSAFFSAKDTITDFDILYFNEKMTAGLLSSGVSREEIDGGFVYAFSNHAALTVRSSRGMFEMPAIGTGGSFFFFHPYTLLYGGYPEDERGVLLSDTAAWKLFGAEDVAGMTVNVGGEDYKVSGVVRLESGKAAEQALGGDDSLVFVPYLTIGERVDCYEAVVPGPVKGTAKRIMDGIYMGSAVKQTDTGRFSALSTLRTIGRLPSVAMSEAAVELPYWENAARNADVRIALWSLFIIIWPVPALIVCIAVLITGAGKNRAQKRERDRRKI